MPPFGAIILSIAVATAGAPCNLCLYGPDNMVFDAAGNLYVVDSDGKTRSRVLELSPGGMMLAQWHVFGVRTRDHYGPEGIALDRNGEILATDAGAASILEISPKGRRLGTLGGSGSFHSLGHVAVDPAGNVYVSQAEPNLIEKFSPTGTLLATWHRDKGAGPKQWSGPETIAAQPDGNLVVEDWANRRIEILSPSGQTIRMFGHAGRGPGEFVNTAGLGVDRNGNIYVADMALHRIQKFDSSGHLLSAIGNARAKPLFLNGGPTAVAVDAHENLYSPDGLSLVKYAQDGTLLARWQ